MSETLTAAPSADIIASTAPQKAKPKPGKLFIHGEFVDSIAGKTFETRNPATGEVITNIAEGRKEDVDLAVKAAHAAFQEGSPWRKTTPRDRGRMLQKLADLIRQNIEELSELETL